MKSLKIIIFCCLLSAACSQAKTATDENIQPASNETVSVSPTPPESVPLKPVKPNLKLNSKQKKYLNESLPPQVREVLEKAESFEILAEVREEEFSADDESLIFEPNRIARITKSSDKMEILEAFYSDAAREDALSACYYPYHKIRAIYQEKAVEIEICFKCSKFIVESQFGKFQGIIAREERKSESVLNKIIQNQSVEFK